LGDSFTEGDGAHSDSTWLKFLERNIGKHDSVNYRFMNAGICGSDPVYQYRLLEKRLLPFTPDLIIVCLGYEIDDIIKRGGFERFEKKGIITDVNELFYATSYIYRLVLHNLFRYNHLLMSKRKYDTEKKNALQIIEQSLLKFKKLSHEVNAQLLLVFYPQKTEVISGKYEHWDDIIVFAEQNDIHFLSLLDYYLNVEKMNISNIHDYTGLLMVIIMQGDMRRLQMVYMISSRK